PVTGSRVITLTPLYDNITKVDVLWNLDLSNIPTLVRGFAKDNFMKTTEEALGRIAQAAE
ncbi:MAG: SRPBCC family protein, partial [Nitrososphaeraceae archaeon]|nr:SRPBCC family protein [Nitrososphaeraceae archaeon]